MKYENCLKITVLLLGLLSFSCSVAHATDLAQVQQVLKGDTVVVVFFNNRIQNQPEMKYIHLIGVEAPELNQAYGQDARSFLSNLVLNQKVQILRIKTVGDHVLARLYLATGTKDPGAELIRSGLAVPKFDEITGLGSVQKAAYETIAEKARFKKVGLWKTGDLFFAQSPSSFRKLELDRVDQPRYNGSPDPKNESFNRPEPPQNKPMRTDLNRYNH